MSPKTTIDNQLVVVLDNNSCIPKLSVRPPPLLTHLAEEKNSSHIFTQNTPNYPMLSQYGISTDFTIQKSINTIRSILREIEKLYKANNIKFSRMNNTIA